MKRCLRAMLVALVFCFAWQVMSCLAQDDNGAATPSADALPAEPTKPDIVVPAVAPTVGMPVLQPVAPPVGAPESAIPPAIEMPADRRTDDAAVPAEAPVEPAAPSPEAVAEPVVPPLDTPAEPAKADVVIEPVAKPVELPAAEPATVPAADTVATPVTAPAEAPVEPPKPGDALAPAVPSASEGLPDLERGEIAARQAGVAAPDAAGTNPEVFEIDRVPLSMSAADAAKPMGQKTGSAGAPVEDWQAESKVSFWGRVFGTKKERSQETAPYAETPQAVSGAGTSASRGFSPDRGDAGMPAGVAVAPAAQVKGKPESQEEILAAQEEVRRQAKEIEGLKNLDLAYQAMSRNEFDQALPLFSRALDIMPIRPYTVETRNKARAALAQCEYRIALKCYQQEDLNEAKRHVAAALGYVPNLKEAQRLGERVDKEIARGVTDVKTSVSKPPPSKPPPVRFSQEHLDRVKSIKDLIGRGRQYMAIREYDKAVNEFKTVLLIDEGNEDANANLKKIAEENYKLQTGQYAGMVVEMMAKVRDTWTPPTKKETIIKQVTTIEQPEVVSSQKQILLNKLNTIIIPQVEFREGNIVDVIKYLNQQAIIADKDAPAGTKGVNIILQLRRPGQGGGAASGEAAPAAPLGGEDLFSAESTAAVAPASSIPTVTMEVHNMVLLDLIKLITDNTGLKFRLESNVVIITPMGVVEGEVLTRTYRVQPSMGDLISGSLGASAAATTAPGVDLLATPTVAGRSNDAKRFFMETGVPFPDGTSIKYQQSLNLIIVANTAENLEKFEQILAKLNVIPVQVEIEARFVEIGQTDLEELGVEWLLTDNWEIAQDASAGAAVPLSARERIQVNKNSFTKGLRNLSDASGLATAGGAMAGIFSLSSVLTNPELSFILHALEQRDGANLLSAPKVTTKSGANAEIKVVREIIYPTEFVSSTQNAGGTQNAATAVVVTPSSFQTRDTGVILNVTPTVGPDGFTIDLTMMPQVVELGGWINYGSTTLGPDGVPQFINMPQPIFHSRSIATSISIWDGQTVVMGGLITEQASSTLDKVPFLGDIPLLGYLFQSKTSKSDKHNLLIFVTANLVDPAGNKVNPLPMGIGAIQTSSSSTATP